jgi:hypothetical protein
VDDGHRHRQRGLIDEEVRRQRPFDGRLGFGHCFSPLRPRVFRYRS